MVRVHLFDVSVYPMCPSIRAGSISGGRTPFSAPRPRSRPPARREPWLFSKPEILQVASSVLDASVKPGFKKRALSAFFYSMRPSIRCIHLFDASIFSCRNSGGACPLLGSTSQVTTPPRLQKPVYRPCPWLHQPSFSGFVWDLVARPCQIPYGNVVSPVHILNASVKPAFKGAVSVHLFDATIYSFRIGEGSYPFLGSASQVRLLLLLLYSRERS